ncbi:putative RNA methyltransferase [Nonomuraea antri]|uniref:putative RNA methyltransferase n=1 Tax=Nonomuraea antri TaxID=2730852 RepID=UPI00156932BE|nr:methyltransferase domain-containing protein [Nonomuraea antri]
MLADVVEYLLCPVCAHGVRLDDRVLRCAQGHAFDVAKQGYVSLLPGDRVPGTADSAEMVEARSAFLASGHYAPLARALAEAVHGRVRREKHERYAETNDGGGSGAYRGAGVEFGSQPGPQWPDGGGEARAKRPVIVDAGTGTGYYLAAVLNAVGGVGVAFDVSKHAVRRAARAHGGVGAFVADVWRTLPIGNAVADVVLNVFAPRNGSEFLRILRPGGAVVVVTPAREHLSPLVAELGLLSVDEEKERRVARSLEGFTEVERQSVCFDMELDGRDIGLVAGMGPSAWHTEPESLQARIAAYIAENVAKGREKVVTRAAFHLSIFEATA